MAIFVEAKREKSLGINCTEALFLPPLRDPAL
jgi:hypothetical protein